VKLCGEAEPLEFSGRQRGRAALKRKLAKAGIQEDASMFRSNAHAPLERGQFRHF